MFSVTIDGTLKTIDGTLFDRFTREGFKVKDVSIVTVFSTRDLYY